MNISPVFSVPASVTTLVPFRRVKLVAAGAAYAGAGEVAVGTLLPGDPGNETQSAIQDLQHGIHFATIGNGTNIAIGDELESFTDGKLVKKTSGALEAIALEACEDEDDQIRVKYVGVPRGLTVFACGVHVWAGGAATTDSIPVVGLLATDVVLVTLTKKSGTQYLLSAANNAAADTIDIILNAVGANTTNELSYAVLRP